MPIVKMGDNRFTRYLEFLRENQAVIYALVLIILIPLILAINTFFVVDSMGKNMDYELRIKAELAGSIVATYSSDYLEDQDTIQSKIQEVKQNSLYDAISTIEVLVPEGEDFRIIASTDAGRIDEVMPQWHYAFVWHEEESIASLIKQKIEGEEERVWRVVTPIVAMDKKVGLVDIGVSTALIDTATQDVLTKSLVVLAFSILFVLLLIANNAKLFQYALLFNKLKEVDKMKDEFISIASHELKTPVTAARGFLSLVEQASEEIDQQIKDDLGKALQCMDRLTELVADLLDVSRIEQQRLKLSLNEVDVTEVVEETVQQMKDQADEKGLFLIYKKSSDQIPAIMVDKSKFRQITWNLVSNAIKYTFTGKVEVIVDFDDQNVSLSVKDTGIGMSNEERDRLFSKFYRVMNRKAKDVVGTGLGLWITKQLVQTMNGKILVDSIENVGSKFTIVFPRADSISKDKRK